MKISPNISIYLKNFYSHKRSIDCSSSNICKKIRRQKYAVKENDLWTTTTMYRVNMKTVVSVAPYSALLWYIIIITTIHTIIITSLNKASTCQLATTTWIDWRLPLIFPRKQWLRYRTTLHLTSIHPTTSPADRLTSTTMSWLRFLAATSRSANVQHHQEQLVSHTPNL